MKLRKGFISNSSTTSFVIIGMPINSKIFRQKFCTTKKIRSCECHLPKDTDIEKIKYCPECGEQAMYEDTILNIAVKDGKIGEFEFYEGILANEDVVIAIPNTHSIGTEEETYLTTIPKNLEKLKNQMMLTLASFDIAWDESKFGIWSGMKGEY